MIQKGEPAVHSPAQRAAKALPALVVAAGLALAADPPGRAASPGEANASQAKPARLIAYITTDDGSQATVYDK